MPERRPRSLPHGVDQQHGPPAGRGVAEVGVLVADQDAGAGFVLNHSSSDMAVLMPSDSAGDLDCAVAGEARRGVVAVGEDARAAEVCPVQVAAGEVLAQGAGGFGAAALAQAPVAGRGAALDGVRVGGGGGRVGGRGDLPGAAVVVGVLGEAAADGVVGRGGVLSAGGQRDLGQLADGGACGVVLGDGGGVQGVVVEGDFVHLAREWVPGGGHVHPAAVGVGRRRGRRTRGTVRR